MKYINLPGTDMQVSRLCLGASEMGVKNTEAEAHKVFDAFVEAGGIFIDTARFYSDWVPGERGRSERILGDWLAARRHKGHIIVATKGGHPPIDAMDRPRLSRGELGRDLDESLQAMRIERIDLYYLHRDDRSIPVEDIVDTLEGFITQGKIRSYGCSNWRVDRIEAAQKYARGRGWHGFVASQCLWNLGVHGMRPYQVPLIVQFDASMRRYHQTTGLAAIPFSSQANGFFAKLLADDATSIQALRASNYWTLRNLELAEAIREVAQEKGMTATGVMLGYLLSQAFPVAPIVGCYTLGHLRECLEGAEMSLDLETVKHLEKAAGAD
jgi:aryl-alcohol dehydrogenase-like predicted oxidoreductase